MSSRIQVILSAEEHERLRAVAASEGRSLSTWVRRAALEKLAAKQRRALRTVGELRAFFAECDAREPGREPDWSEHVEVMARSRSTGTGQT